VLRSVCEDAEAFAKWAGKRLPKEAEWEWAARVAPGYLYPWGQEWDPTKDRSRANVAASAREGDEPEAVAVDGKLDYNNEHPRKILHLIGNVAEWTADTYGAYAGGELPSADRAKTSWGVVRGGSIASKDAKECTATFRFPVPASVAQDWIGFRCVKDSE
ncbi:formylglycine-generating enzyme family protein, partial [Planctomycetota bacterium]